MSLSNGLSPENITLDPNSLCSLAQLLRDRIRLPEEAAYRLGLFRNGRQQFREFIKREAAKILFDQ
jgi:hypothetical protein